MKPILVLPLWAALALTGCVTSQLPPESAPHHAAAVSLEKAEARSTPDDQRAALYLDAAAQAQKLFPSQESGEAARLIYNKAAAELTVLLRNSGSQWNRPLVLSSGSNTWHLRYAKGTIRDPGFFTSFKPAADVPMGIIKRRDVQEGIGGALVGIRKTEPRESFAPLVGVTAPVTALLDFKGSEVTLSLVDPTVKTRTLNAGASLPLQADFSAPLAYYPQKNELFEGLMGAIRGSDYMKNSGLYMVEPYDAKRIPLIFVHGLISTPMMWRNVINDIETDPVLRGRYQCWAYYYPTGNPPMYSAMRLREELARLRQVHPDMKHCVLIGHSMGGILSRVQATTLTRESWDVIGKDKAATLFSKMPKGSLVERACIFKANPHIDREIFICTPHRGSELAISSIGEFAMRLITLPIEITSEITSTVGQTYGILTGDPNRVPNSVTGLSPKNPVYKVLDARPIEATHHSIIGDRGKGDTPNSSDGVVEYWSSHLASAKSEKIVPGPHGSCELPETIAEIKRILHEHLGTQASRTDG